VLLALLLLLGACASSYPRGGPPVAFDPRPYYSQRALSVLYGTASYYADSLAGRATANGEAYDPSYFTAAHRTLPLGTILRVTRLGTGDWVLVRVNDRGPYASAERILDLSKAAARRLGMLRAGVVKIRAEVLEWGRKRSRRRH
jgi:peptidoglycan lytic transglycosylase